MNTEQRRRALCAAWYRAHQRGDYGHAAFVAAGFQMEFGRPLVPPSTTATTATQAWRAASMELDHATLAYHQAIDATERAAAVCNFAWYDAARSTEREAAERYVLAVRGEHVTRAAMVDATRAAMEGAGHATA